MSIGEESDVELEVPSGTLGLHTLGILRGGKGRPIFFIGHSLGGIVIKKASSLFPGRSPEFALL